MFNHFDTLINQLNILVFGKHASTKDSMDNVQDHHLNFFVMLQNIFNTMGQKFLSIFIIY